MMFDDIVKLRPYFFSLREINNENVSLDIKMPLTWEYESIITQYSSITLKLQDKREKYSLISLISSANEEGYGIVFACANEILTTNKEMEEKKILFQTKVKELEDSFKAQVKELENLFVREPLDKIKELTVIEDVGEKSAVESPEGIGLVDKGDGKGPEGDNIKQDKVN